MAYLYMSSEMTATGFIPLTSFCSDHRCLDSISYVILVYFLNCCINLLVIILLVYLIVCWQYTVNKDLSSSVG